MELTKQQLLEVIACVNYYQMRHVSVNNPRHDEFDDILKTLHKSLQELDK